MTDQLGATGPQDSSGSRFDSIREIAASAWNTVAWFTAAAMVGVGIGWVTNPRPLKTPVKEEVKQEWMQELPSQDYRLSSATEDPMLIFSDPYRLPADIETFTYDMEIEEILEGMEEGEEFRGYDLGDVSGLAPRYYEELVDPEPFRSFAGEIYERMDTDRERVQAVWEFVGDNVTYERDDSLSVEYLPADTPLHPMETLYNESGDCEDMAILNASMLEAMPADWDVELLTLNADSPDSLETYFDSNHVAVYVNTGEYETVVEAVSSFDMEGYDQYDRVEAYTNGERVTIEL